MHLLERILTFKIKDIFKKNTAYLPMLLFHIVFLVIFFTNITWDAYFLGWDSLSPEFDFWLNIKRALFSGFWQENYGLGTLGGHGFAATLPHTLITALLSIIVPHIAIRAVFTFLCLYIGSLGMYFLVQNLFTHLFTKEVPDETVERPSFIPYISLLAALFYMLNLGTVQMFYLQLETFIGHFAALPWLFWILIRLLKETTRKNLLLFLLINFFATLQGFIPSLFVAYIVALCIFLLCFVIAQRRSISAYKKAFFVLFLTGVINAYWLLPLVGYQLTYGSDFLNSYNNLSSTPHFIDVNKKYGDIVNVPLLKGYLFDAYQLGGFMLDPWITHHNNILVKILGYISFGMIITGILYTILKKRNSYFVAFACIFFFFFVSLATSTFPFSLITELLQKVSPTYEQAFRTSFTKFSIGASFTYSIFFAFGIYFVVQQLVTRKKQHAIFPVFLITLVALLLYALPALQGKFVYQNLYVQLPKAYTDVMDYFATKPQGRIADFPQDCSEGWYSYNWGYFGSGFYWYGVKQPFLSRSFDVWSKYNENYFWEITQAMREEDYQKMDQIFDKYDVKWVLYDPNALYCRNQRAFLTHEAWVKHMETSGQYRSVQTFAKGVTGPIKLFENTNDVAKNYVGISTTLPNIQPSYHFTDNDAALSITSTYQTTPNKKADLYYPFRSLFTKRNTLEKEFTLTSTKDHFTFSNTLPKGLANQYLIFQSIKNTEVSIPLEITIATNEASLNITASPLLPVVTLDNQKITTYEKDILLGTIRAVPTNLEVIFNGTTIDSKSLEKYVYRTYFHLQTTNILEIKNEGITIFEWNDSENASLKTLFERPYQFRIPPYKKGVLHVTIPKTEDNHTTGMIRMNKVDQVIPHPCNEVIPSERNRYEIGGTINERYIRLLSKESSQCIEFFFPDAITKYGYLLEARSKNITGNAPRLTIYNKGRVIYNDVYLSGIDKMTSFYQLLPPTFRNEVGYDVQFSNTSENTIETINDFQGVNMWQVPYETLKEMVISPVDTIPAPKQIPLTLVTHPLDTYYTVTLHQSLPKGAYVTLSQSYDPSWKAYSISDTHVLKRLFPFIFGQEIQTHTLVNNWKNGWELLTPLNKETTIIIIYVPQYLQYVGYIGLFLTFLLLLWPRKWQIYS